ncbi:MAG: S66 peptidase family protein [Jiangellaceae bacterium]
MGVPVLTRPPRLRPGDRVAVVAPSGRVPKDRLDTGCAILRGWGLDVVVAPHVLDMHDRFDYLAGTDADRAADLQAAWLDPSVAAVLCARGGYGVQRILDRLDWSAMRGVAPKVLAGHSDITSLQEAFATQLGVVTLHAPMVGAHVFVTDEPTAEMFRRTLFEPESVQRLTSATAHTLVPGVAHGVTMGGCLALLAAELGTATGRSGAEGGILLLEDVDEKAYRIDGFLTHLLRAGWLDGVAGVVLGSWKDCEPVEELLLDRLTVLGVPVVSELGFGHGDSSLTVPLGLPATLDADAATLTVDVPALV